MKMSLRWFSEGNDSVSLNNIRQIPNVSGVISSIESIPVGEVWSEEAISKLKNEVEGSGLSLYGIESVNIHDSIKAAADDRDRYIENYCRTLENLGRAGIRLVCYNFMPVFDWMRTELNQPLSDGSFAMAYRHAVLDGLSPDDMIQRMRNNSNGYSLPGWEPERLEKIEALFRLYNGITHEKLMDNLVYFLKAIMPACQKYDIKMAIHPDDPPWCLFKLPRVIHNSESIEELLTAVPDVHNGITFCTGSLGADRTNDLPQMAQRFADRIHFAHLRNIQYGDGLDFAESAHPTECGSLDMYGIVKALYEGGFDGVIRPDHGRAVWGESCRPGYGLYDRAMGACYLTGLWEAVVKNGKNTIG